MKRVLPIISLLVLLISCVDNTKAPTTEEAKIEGVETPKYACYQDSLLDVVVDTSSVQGKQEYLRNQFLINESPSVIDYDTILDFNFDGRDDYVIGYYALSGTGMKNRIMAYSFQNNSYHYDSIISSIPNPTFQLENKRITGFYIPHGGGWGMDLRWKNGKWTTYMKFDMDNTAENIEDDVVWKLYYPATKKTMEIKAPYEFTPPESVLPFKVK